jgi:hypothetical protein
MKEQGSAICEDERWKELAQGRVQYWLYYIFFSNGSTAP